MKPPCANCALRPVAKITPATKPRGRDWCAQCREACARSGKAPVAWSRRSRLGARKRNAVRPWRAPQIRRGQFTKARILAEAAGIPTMTVWDRITRKGMSAHDAVALGPAAPRRKAGG